MKGTILLTSVIKDIRIQSQFWILVEKPILYANKSMSKKFVSKTMVSQL